MTDRRGYVRRRRYLAALLVAGAALAAALAAVPVFARAASGAMPAGGRTGRREIVRMWEEGSFRAVFEASGEGLERRPLDYFLLTMRGFSAYQLGLAQVDGMRAAAYFDASIRSLRKALLLPEAAGDGRVYYVLGKAYFRLGDGFADLTLHFLRRARELGHFAADIPEFLGMAYAALGDYRGSVVAFSEALHVARPSPPLLLAIAASYAGLGELETARAYLVRAVSVSRDAEVTLAAGLFLSDVLLRLGDTAGAAAQLAGLSAESGESAEVRFRLGELYAASGDTVRSRAEWRRALDIDPTHLAARQRLSL